MMGPKGVSPIISAVLLIAFTMTVATIAGPFFSENLQKAQDDASEDAKKTLTATDLGLDIRSATYNRTTSNLTVLIQNTGNQPIENISLTVFGDNIYHRQFSNKLNQRSIGRYEINAGDNFDLKSVKASLTEYPVSVEKDLNGRPSEDHLIGYWPMDDSSGSTAKDAVGSHDGTLLNGSSSCSGGTCPVWSTGVHGSAISLDGSNDYINTGTGGHQVESDNPRTICAWAKTNGFNHGGIFQAGPTGTYAKDYSFRTKTSADNWRIQFWGSADWDVTLSGSANSWHHYCLSYDGQTAKFYYDGELHSSRSRDLDTGAHAVWLGRWASYYFNGKIDEVKVWNTALTKQQIKDPVVVR